MTSDATQVTDGSPRHAAQTAAQDVPPGYKQTEVGVIPEDWSIYSLFELAGESKSRFDDGDWVEAEFLTESGVRLLQTGNIGVGEFVDKESRKYISDHSFDFLRCKDVHPGDLLICRLADPAGRACVVPDLGERRMITSVDVTIFRPVPELAASRFLLHVFGTRKWFADVSDRCGGSTRSRIARGQLAKIKVQAPTVREQRAIAEALSDVDGLLGALEALIAKKRAIKQAAMQQLLTGETRLPGFSGEWEVKRLGDIADIEMGQSPSSAFYNTNGTGLPLIQGNADIVDRRSIRRIFTTQITKRGRRGDILLSVRAPVGEVSRATFDVCLGRGVCAIRFPNDFLFHYLVYLEPSWARHSRGSTFDSVNSTDVRSVQIALPGPREQSAIATVLSDMDAEIAALEARRDNTRAIKQGMMQQLLTGRVRLVKPEAAA